MDSSKEKFSQYYDCEALEKLIREEEDFKNSYIRLKDINVSVLSSSEADQLQQRILMTELGIEKLKERLAILKDIRMQA